MIEGLHPHFAQHLLLAFAVIPVVSILILYFRARANATKD